MRVKSGEEFGKEWLVKRVCALLLVVAHERLSKYI
jgi:hypothetical protein